MVASPCTCVLASDVLVLSGEIFALQLLTVDGGNILVSFCRSSSQNIGTGADNSIILKDFESKVRNVFILSSNLIQGNNFYSLLLCTITHIAQDFSEQLYRTPSRGD